MLASLPVRLLADRVREGGGELDIDEEIAPFVAELCRRCGGLPLALELVAAQLAAMSVRRPARPPAGGDRGGRRPGCAAIAQSSYELLHDDEATVFRRLGVLDGPVTLPLVRDVVAGGPIAPVRVVRILRELTARGLLAVDRSGPALALPPGRRPAPVRARAAGSRRRGTGRHSTGSPDADRRDRCPRRPEPRPARTSTRSTRCCPSVRLLLAAATRRPCSTGTAASSCASGCTATGRRPT